MSNIVDVESLIYKAATASEQLLPDINHEGIYCQAYCMDNVKEFFNTLFNDIAGVTGDDDFIFVFGSEHNYRKVLNPDYKAHRVEQRKHPMLGIVKKYIIEKYNTTFTDWLEADDVCRILYENNPFKNTIISIDKDLRTFPVKLLNPDRMDDGIVKITPEQADYNFATQLIMGDKTDGYGGVSGYGEAKTRRLLDSCKDKLTVDKVKELFLGAGGNTLDFIHTYNMAHIIGRNDYYEGIGIKLYNTYFDFNKGEQVEKL